jgi:hypothetical protein
MTTLQISSDIKYHRPSFQRVIACLCTMPLNMKISFAHSNVAAVEGA